MSRLFISHSSRDNAVALAVAQWLEVVPPRRSPSGLARRQRVERIGATLWSNRWPLLGGASLGLVMLVAWRRSKTR